MYRVGSIQILHRKKIIYSYKDLKVLTHSTGQFKLGKAGFHRSGQQSGNTSRVDAIVLRPNFLLF